MRGLRSSWESSARNSFSCRSSCSDNAPASCLSATLTIAARLKRFDVTLEEAAFNLGASRAAVLWTVTLPYLGPALVGAAAISFLMSFENFNTTLMLVGSDPPLTVMMYGRMREGASPVLNAVSLFLMVASALLALALLRRPDVPARAAP